MRRLLHHARHLSIETHASWLEQRLIQHNRDVRFQQRVVNTCLSSFFLGLALDTAGAYTAGILVTLAIPVAGLVWIVRPDRRIVMDGKPVDILLQMPPEDAKIMALPRAELIRAIVHDAESCL